MRLIALGGVLLAVLLLVLGSRNDPALRPQLGPEIFLWMLATVGAAFATISLGPTRPALAMDLPVLLACAFVLGPLSAGLVALLAATTPDELRGRLTFSRAAWNHAQTCLSVLAAGYVFLWLGGTPGNWPASVVAAIAAILADTAINYLSVALLTAVAEERAVVSVVRDMVIGSPTAFAISYGAFALTSLLIAEAYAAVGPVSLVVALAPVVLARQVFLDSHRLERLARQVRWRAAALTKLDERIAEERRDERARVADALHDDVLQALYSVTLHAHVIREAYRSGRLLDLEKGVPPLVDAAERASALVRDAVFGIRRSPVGRAGLVQTASLLVTHVSDESGVEIVSDIDPSVTADPAVELLAYQVLREALANAVRHANADKIRVTLRSLGGEFRLSVVDDGRGFDVHQRGESNHFGLDMMAERARAAGGSLEIVSSIGRGTAIEARFKLSLG